VETDTMHEEETPAAEATVTPKTRRNWRQVKAENEANKKTVEPGAVDAKPDRVRILLEENDNIPPGGQFFGVNGAGFLLRPGVAVSVPRGILDILDNAVMDVPVVSPDNMQVIGYRKKLRYPYRVADRAA
jgi:hypothetical protein